MTEKELLYLEDAALHEKSIINICQDMSLKLSSDNLVEFLNNQILEHQNILDNLTNLLKEKANE